MPNSGTSSSRRPASVGTAGRSALVAPIRSVRHTFVAVRWWPPSCWSDSYWATRLCTTQVNNANTTTNKNTVNPPQYPNDRVRVAAGSVVVRFPFIRHLHLILAYSYRQRAGPYATAHGPRRTFSEAWPLHPRRCCRLDSGCFEMSHLFAGVPAKSAIKESRDVLHSNPNPQCTSLTFNSG